MMNFYSLNCLQIRDDAIQGDFLLNSYIDKQTVISNKNYKQKKSIEIMLPMLVLKLFQTLKVPGRIQFFHKEVSIEEEIEYSTTLNM